MECQICIEKYDKNKHKVISCNSCNYHLCLECYKNYLFLSNQKAHCIFCKTHWSRLELGIKTGAKFMNTDYKSYYQNIVYEMEKCHFPETQIKITRMQKEKKIADLKVEYTEKLKKLILELREISIDSYVQKEDQKLVIKKCSQEDCKGLMDTTGFCSLCQNYSCVKCLEIISQERENHICDKEKLETLKFLEKETKACPKCSIRINKVEGTCSQMFCTNCNTVFDWESGKEIKKGFMHNPHYLDWRKKQRNTQIDIVCALNMLDYLLLLAGNSLIHNDIPELCRRIFHINEEKNYFDNQKTNDDLRFKYLTNQIDENKFKTLLYQRDKKKEKDELIYEVLTLFCKKSINKILDFTQRVKKDIKEAIYENIENHIKDLYTYLEIERVSANEKLYVIGESFNSKKYLIDVNFSLQ